MTATVYTAEEFLRIEDDEGPVELVNGKVTTMPPAFPRHGTIYANIAYYLQMHVRLHDLGRVMTNDVSIVTRRDPDTVRGADVAYVSYMRVAKGTLPAGFLPAQPELIVEVRSPNDRWKDLLDKISEYLDAAVTVVCVVDPTSETAHVYRSDRNEEQLSGDDVLRFDDILPGFSVPLKKLFE